MKKTILLLFLFSISIHSCDFSKRIDTTAAVKEMRAREVKRILPQDIVLETERLGQIIQGKLERSMDSSAQIAQKYHISIVNGTAKELIIKAKDPKIKETLDAIDYSFNQNQEIPASIQKNTQGDSLFYFFINPKKQVIMLGFAKKEVVMGMGKM
ncbi:hypothetical protein V7S79_10970 [Aquirufa sp. ROCK-SH2]